MTQDFTQNFIRLRRRGLAAESLTELGFNHAESALDVRPPVVMLHKPFLIVLVEIKYLFHTALHKKSNPYPHVEFAKTSEHNIWRTPLTFWAKPLSWALPKKYPSSTRY